MSSRLPVTVFSHSILYDRRVFGVIILFSPAIYIAAFVLQWLEADLLVRLAP